MLTSGRGVWKVLLRFVLIQHPFQFHLQQGTPMWKNNSLSSSKWCLGHVGLNHFEN